MTPHVSITLLRTQTDERLVELIAAGHDRAFEAIVDRYRRPLLRYARRFLHEEARAEDVVQSAFVSAWSALREGTTVRELRPWLYRIVQNGALNVMKKPGREDAMLIEASDLRPGPALEVEQREDVRQALDTIAGLPERQRAALLAVAFDGRSHADVGAELGLKEPAVRQLVHRARASLRVAVTAVTPWPMAVWLAGVGGSQAGDTAARVGEVVGGVGAGTLFGGGAMKAGAIVAAAGAVAVGAPKMAEVARQAPRPVATASAATGEDASARAQAAAHRAAGVAEPVSLSQAAPPTGGGPAGARSRHATSGGWSHSGSSSGQRPSGGPGTVAVPLGTGDDQPATTPAAAVEQEDEHRHGSGDTSSQAEDHGSRHTRPGTETDEDHGAKDIRRAHRKHRSRTRKSGEVTREGTRDLGSRAVTEKRRREHRGEHTSSTESRPEPTESHSNSTESGSTTTHADEPKTPEQPEVERSSGSESQPVTGTSATEPVTEPRS